MAAIMGVALLVLLVQDIPLSTYLRQAEHDKIVTALERDAFVLAGRSEEALRTSPTTVNPKITAIARKYQTAGGARVVIVNQQGYAVFTSDADAANVGDPYKSRPEIAQALKGQPASGSRYSETLQVELLYVTVPIYSGDSILGAVRLTYPASVVNTAVDAQIRLLGIVALTTVILAGVVGAIISSTVTRRLKLLREATEQLADGTGDVRADENVGAPEIRSLSRSFNQMADRLHRLIEQQRAFAADASHQLRTPLTALRLRLERARELVETDPRGAMDRLSAAEAEADRLQSILEGLLLLSRTEGSSAPVERMDLAQIARERVEQWQPLAGESGVWIRYEGPETAAIQAVPLAPEQIIDNYLDNALSVSPPGSSLVVYIAAAGNKTVLHVLDDGPGLSPEDAKRAFDRFWRASSETVGSGLGLAIVAQLARASGGSAALGPRPTGGLDASATFNAQ
jgi:signal transduction histidine kinase